MMELAIEVQDVIESLQRQVLEYSGRLAQADAAIAALQAKLAEADQADSE